MDVFHNWTTVCETVCNMSCVPGCSGANCSGTNETVCAPTNCREECVTIGAASPYVTASLSTTSSGLVVRFRAVAALVAEQVVAVIVPVSEGFALPLAGTPAATHGVSLTLPHRVVTACTPLATNNGTDTNTSNATCRLHQEQEADTWGLGQGYLRTIALDVTPIGAFGAAAGQVSLSLYYGL